MARLHCYTLIDSFVLHLRRSSSFYFFSSHWIFLIVSLQRILSFYRFFENKFLVLGLCKNVWILLHISQALFSNSDFISQWNWFVVNYVFFFFLSIYFLWITVILKLLIFKSRIYYLNHHIYQLKPLCCLLLSLKPPFWSYIRLLAVLHFHWL